MLKQFKKILVTGGGGFLGSAIIKKLINRCEEIVSYSRSYYPLLENLGIRQIQGSIEDKDAVSKAIEDSEVVFHVAAKAGIWGKYDDYYQANYIGSVNVTEACIKNQVSKLIYTSSPSVIFNGMDIAGASESDLVYPEKYLAHYPKTKAMAEKYVIKKAHEYKNKNGLLAISLRPHLIWGPGDNHLIPRILAKSKKIAKISAKNCLIDTTYIDDAAEAHILAAESLDHNPNLSGNVYFISQGNPIPLWDLVNRILAIANLSPVKRSIPYTLAYIVATIMETTHKLFNINKEPLITRFIVEELYYAHWFNINAAKKDLGYNPTTSMDAGMEKLREWLSMKSE